MSDKISVIGVQTTLTKDRTQNFGEALRIMEEALKLYKYADVVVLPENFVFFPRKDDLDSIGEVPEEYFDKFSKYAKTYNTYIVAGTIINRRQGKLYNTSFLFDRKGNVVGSYDKVHLFDALNAAFEDKESYIVNPGEKAFAYEADFGKIGIMICYDIRFPEMVRSLALQGVQYLFVPAAFYMPRFDHWQSLIQTAALQNSIYVAGANLYLKADKGPGFCGRSLIADPWGVAVATASDKAGFIQAYMDKNYSEEIGGAVGSLINRVPGTYNIP